MDVQDEDDEVKVDGCTGALFSTKEVETDFRGVNPKLRRLLLLVFFTWNGTPINAGPVGFKGTNEGSRCSVACLQCLADWQ